MKKILTTYIALLRGINVGGHKKLPMAELRNMLHRKSFKNISTYIQSGNVVFDSDKTDTKILERELKRHIHDTFGFDVPVLIHSKMDFEKILLENPFTDSEALKNNQIYFVLLKSTPEKENVEVLQKEVYVNEKSIITTNCLYLLCQNGYGNAKLNNNLVEKKLKVEATTRNYRTMLKLLEMARK